MRSRSAGKIETTTATPSAPRAGDILLAHDGHAARGADGVAVVVSMLPALLDRIDALGLVAVTLPEAARLEVAATSATAS